MSSHSNGNNTNLGNAALRRFNKDSFGTKNPGNFPFVLILHFFFIPSYSECADCWLLTAGQPWARYLVGDNISTKIGSGRVEIEIREASPIFWLIGIGIGEASPIFWQIGHVGRPPRSSLPIVAAGSIVKTKELLSTSFLKITPSPLCVAVLLRLVNSVRRKELGRWIGRRSSQMGPSPGQAGTREEVRKKLLGSNLRRLDLKLP